MASVSFAVQVFAPFSRFLTGFAQPAGSVLHKVQQQINHGSLLGWFHCFRTRIKT